jgi:hypothetical protein
MQNNVVFSTISIDELLFQVRCIIKEEISAEIKKDVEQLISPEQACKVFDPSVSKVTLHKWEQDGYLKKYRIGGRTYYKRSEIVEAAKTFKKYKQRRMT